MHIEFLVEEPSAEAALDVLLPRLVGRDVGYQIHPHEGKKDLLDRLPSKLRAYSKWIPADWRLVVLVDLDGDDCRKLKRQLETAAQTANLKTKSRAKGRQTFQVLNRIAIEELEAWFFGDVAALCVAYPGVPQTLGEKKGFRDADGIKGGTWERLEAVLQKAGYFRGGLAKIEAARRIAEHMDPGRNRSRSFHVFRDGLKAIVAS